MGPFGFVLSIILLVFVVPLWLVFHYGTRWRTTRRLSSEDEALLSGLWEDAAKMEERIKSLEAILDADAPDWRSRT